MRTILNTLLTATLASTVASATAAALSRASGAQPAAPVNAVSRMLWGERSLLHRRPSPRYTGVGALLNFGGCLFWSAVVEGAQRARPVTGTGATLARGAALAGAAYTVDQILLPPAWRPAYHRVLGAPQVLAVYATLALTLPLRSYLAARGTRRLAARQRSATLARTPTRLSSSR